MADDGLSDAVRSAVGCRTERRVVVVELGGTERRGLTRTVASVGNGTLSSRHVHPFRAGGMNYVVTTEAGRAQVLGADGIVADVEHPAITEQDDSTLVSGSTLVCATDSEIVGLSLPDLRERWRVPAPLAGARLRFVTDGAVALSARASSTVSTAETDDVVVFR
ncbi:hypothetical protein MTP03_17850 [Tsukamurella sp. PLM1]|nr:hypothetical protein MTP03_17850 [Tsukamurella sp. PLM1]